MGEAIDYDQCKTRRPALYIFTYITYLLALVTVIVLVFGVGRKLDEIKAMQPCSTVTK